MQVKMDRRLGDPSTEKRAVETFPVPPFTEKSVTTTTTVALPAAPREDHSAHRLLGRAFVRAGYQPASPDRELPRAA